MTEIVVILTHSQQHTLLHKETAVSLHSHTSSDAFHVPPVFQCQMPLILSKTAGFIRHIISASADLASLVPRPGGIELKNARKIQMIVLFLNHICFLLFCSFSHFFFSIWSSPFNGHHFQKSRHFSLYPFTYSIHLSCLPNTFFTSIFAAQNSHSGSSRVVFAQYLYCSTFYQRFNPRGALLA